MWIANRVSHHLARLWALWACFLIAAEITLTELIWVLELVLFWAIVNAFQRSAMYAWEARDSIAEAIGAALAADYPPGPSVFQTWHVPRHSTKGRPHLSLLQITRFWPCLALRKTECVLDVWILCALSLTLWTALKGLMVKSSPRW